MQSTYQWLEEGGLPVQGQPGVFNANKLIVIKAKLRGCGDEMINGISL